VPNIRTNFATVSDAAVLKFQTRSRIFDVTSPRRTVSDLKRIKARASWQPCDKAGFLGVFDLNRELTETAGDRRHARGFRVARKR
jgi:hypothetical protein